MGCISNLQKMKIEGSPSQDVRFERRTLGSFPAQDQQMMKPDRLAGIISPVLGVCLMQSAPTGLNHCLVLKTPTTHTHHLQSWKLKTLHCSKHLFSEVFLTELLGFILTTHVPNVQHSENLVYCYPTGVKKYLFNKHLQSTCYDAKPCNSY